MPSTLSECISNSVANNGSTRGLTYYKDRWKSLSFGEIETFAVVFGKALKETIVEEWTYVLLHLEITWTYPVLILGILKAKYGFICVGKDDSLLDFYTTELNVKYIVSNIDSKTEAYVARNFFLEKKLSILDEELLIWTSQSSLGPIKHVFEFLYAIQTSGTTGIPKVVQVPDQCIYPNIKSLSEILNISTSDTILLMTPVTFDPSVVEVFLSLYNACSLCIIDSAAKEDPQRLADLAFKPDCGSVTVLQTTPSLFKRWSLQEMKKTLFSENSTLRTIILGGEEFPTLEEIKTWEVPQHVSLYNIYGVTEVSCWSSIQKVHPSPKPSRSISSCLSETVLELHDCDSEDAKEIFIGSKTRKCLIGNENPKDIFRLDEFLFRPTGDLCKEVNGDLYFLGRKDNLLKRWGKMVNLSEIENITMTYHNSHDCCSVGIKFDNHLRIGLFVILKNESLLSDLKQFLKKSLPPSSWPDIIKSLPSLPLTKHGKICRATLAKLCSDQFKSKGRAVFDDYWETYTRNSSLDATNGFLSAGGDSFTALQFFNELKLIWTEIPDSFFGHLLQNWDRNRLWNFLEDNKNSQECCSFSGDIENFKTVNTFSNLRVVQKISKGTVVRIESSKKVSFPHADLRLKKLVVDWKYFLGKCIDASPSAVIFSHGRCLVVIGSHSGRLAVLDIDGQKAISECTLPHRIESSPIIASDGRFYYVGCYDHCLYCISLFTGEISWKFQTGDIIKSPAVLHNSSVIFGSYDSYIYCLSCRGEKLEWKTKVMSPVLAQPQIKDNLIYSATLGSLAVLDVEAGLLLKEITSPPVFSTPVISRNGLVVGHVTKKVSWLSFKDINEIGHFETGDAIFSSMVNVEMEDKELVIFGCNDSHLYCLEVGQGTTSLLWKVQADSKVVSTPCVLMTSPSSGLVITFSSAGKCSALDLLSGEILFEHSLPGEVFSSPIIVGDHIVVGCRDDNVYILKIINEII